MGVFDLRAYLARIGWEGPVVPDLFTLRALVARQVDAIPFEGIEALLGRTPSLDPGALQAKLVRLRRGGWCFEQNTLLWLALREIGFTARPLLARVRWGVPPEQPMPRTHMALRVELPEGAVMADAGFGALTLTGPLALRPEEVQETPHGPCRLMPDGEGLMLQARLGEDWADLYLLGLEPQHAVDIEAANWLVANRPGGIFTANLVAARAPAGRRLALLNRKLTIRASESAETILLPDGAESLRETLAGQFGIALNPQEAKAVAAALAEARFGHVAMPG